MYKIAFFILVACISTKSLMAQAKKANAAVLGNPQKGNTIYQTKCLSCHQADGGGVPHLNPPLSESSWVNGDKKRIIQVILKGMSDRIAIDDEYYSNSMPAFAHLSNQEIADVLTFIRQNFGNQSSAVSVAEVAAVRSPKAKKH